MRLLDPQTNARPSRILETAISATRGIESTRERAHEPDASVEALRRIIDKAHFDAFGTLPKGGTFSGK